MPKFILICLLFVTVAMNNCGSANFQTTADPANSSTGADQVDGLQQESDSGLSEEVDEAILDDIVGSCITMLERYFLTPSILDSDENSLHLEYQPDSGIHVDYDIAGCKMTLKTDQLTADYIQLYSLLKTAELIQSGPVVVPDIYPGLSKKKFIVSDSQETIYAYVIAGLPLLNEADGKLAEELIADILEKISAIKTCR